MCVCVSCCVNSFFCMLHCVCYFFICNPGFEKSQIKKLTLASSEGVDGAFSYELMQIPELCPKYYFSVNIFYSLQENTDLNAEFFCAKSTKCQTSEILPVIHIPLFLEVKLIEHLKGPVALYVSHILQN